MGIEKSLKLNLFFNNTLVIKKFHDNSGTGNTKIWDARIPHLFVVVSKRHEGKLSQRPHPEIIFDIGIKFL